jgi:hypothetical protein
MDGLAQSRLKGIVAPLNFLAPMSEKPYSYNYQPPPGVPLRNTDNVEHTVTVHDARNAEPSLDREGFVLVHHKTAAADLYDEDIITRVYYPECERLMREATGAKKVIAFDHIVRNAAKAAIPGSGVKLPAGRVHNDYTAWSAPQRVRDLMGDEAGRFCGTASRSTMCGARSPARCCARRWRCATRRASRTKTLSPRICATPTAPARSMELPITASALVLFPEDAAGRSGADPLLRLGPRRRRAVLRPRRLRRPADPGQRPAARKHRSPHAGVFLTN